MTDYDSSFFPDYFTYQLPYRRIFLIKREYYSLESAASKIGCSIDDLLYLGSTGEIAIIALTTGLKGILFNRNCKPISEIRSLDFILDHYCFVPSEALIRYQSDKTRGKVNNKIQILNTPDNSGNYWIFNGEKDGIPINGSSLFILETTLDTLSGTGANQLLIKNEPPKTPLLASKLHTTSNKIDWKIASNEIGTQIWKDHPNLSKRKVAEKTYLMMEIKHKEGVPGMTNLRGPKLLTAESIERRGLEEAKNNIPK